MVIYKKIYLEVQIHNQYICLKNNTAQLYFVLGRAELYWKFSRLLGRDTDIHRFPTMYMVKTHFLLEYLLISNSLLVYWINPTQLGFQQNKI